MFLIHTFFLHCRFKCIKLYCYLINNFKWLDKFFFKKFLQSYCIKVNNEIFSLDKFILFGDIICLINFVFHFQNKSFCLNKFFLNLLFFNIIYESSFFLVLNKPFGLLTQSTSKEKNILNTIRLFYKIRLDLVHRLDKFSTGCLIFSKNYFFSKLFFKFFFFGNIEKIYYTLIEGIFYGSLVFTFFLYNKKNILYKKKYFSLLYIKAIHCFKDCTLIEVKLITGKKHQIRLCCVYYKYPIIGEPYYFFKKKVKIIKDKNFFFLHARSIKFTFLNKKVYFIKASFDYYFCFTIFFILSSI